jgi:glycosyltransferase involved in cell wall biosynthesis
VWHAREIVFQSPSALKFERVLARRFAEVVIAISAAVADQLDPANVVVVTDEADPAVFHPGRAGVFRARESIDDRAPLIGSVARIDTWKGFDLVLDALPGIRQTRPDAELVIAGGEVPGKEEYAARLQHRAANLPGVHWLGPRRDVAELMADLDAFVQVSTEPEPFGLVVVEALASGVPVVAGAEGGPLEILGADPGPAGRLVPPGDATALAAAVLEVLPAVASDTARRRARVPLRRPTLGRFAQIFDQVRTAGRRRPFRGR